MPLIVLLVLVVVGLVMLTFILIGFEEATHTLSRKLKKAGDLTGKSAQEWIDALGPTEMASVTQDGHHVLQWRSGRYQIQRIVVVFRPDGSFGYVQSRQQV